MRRLETATDQDDEPPLFYRMTMLNLLSTPSLRINKLALFVLAVSNPGTL